MGVNFTARESSALRILLAENANDIILKTDRRGYILHASPSIERWGLPLPGSLTGTHILHLAHPSCAAQLRREHAAVIDARQDGGWTEFLALAADGRESWFEIRMHCLLDEANQAYGAVSLLRSIEERRRLEDQLFTAAMTDPLTGLTNRRAFIAMLQHIVDKRIHGCLAVFDIDYFKAINMQHGQAAGDEVLLAFSDLLRSLMRAEDIISRISGEKLSVLLPHVSAAEAEAICRRIIAALAEIRSSAGADSFPITASAGITPIGGTLDTTLKRAELALFLAKAKGRNRLEIDASPFPAGATDGPVRRLPSAG